MGLALMIATAILIVLTALWIVSLVHLGNRLSEDQCSCISVEEQIHVVDPDCPRHEEPAPSSMQ